MAVKCGERKEREIIVLKEKVLCVTILLCDTWCKKPTNRKDILEKEKARPKYLPLEKFLEDPTSSHDIGK